MSHTHTYTHKPKPLNAVYSNQHANSCDRSQLSQVRTVLEYMPRCFTAGGRLYSMANSNYYQVFSFAVHISPLFKEWMDLLGKGVFIIQCCCRFRKCSCENIIMASLPHSCSLTASLSRPIANMDGLLYFKIRLEVELFIQMPQQLFSAAGPVRSSSRRGPSLPLFTVPLTGCNLWHKMNQIIATLQFTMLYWNHIYHAFTLTRWAIIKSWSAGSNEALGGGATVGWVHY